MDFSARTGGDHGHTSHAGSYAAPAGTCGSQTGGAIKGGGFVPNTIGNAGGFQFTGNFGGFQPQFQPQPQFTGIEGPLAQILSGAARPAAVPLAPAGALASRPELKLDSEVKPQKYTLSSRCSGKASMPMCASCRSVAPIDPVGQATSAIIASCVSVSVSGW